MKPDCSKCRHYIFSPTLGSNGISVWHCRDGFEPFIGMLTTFVPPMPYSCIEEANNNHPISYVQLEFNFQ